jgi:diguanylate cyclase (GGDEF)-like protein
MSRLKTWWGQSDQFDWVTTFLRQRGLIRPAQVILAMIALSGMGVPFALLISQRGSTVVSVIVGVVTVACTVFGTYYWLTFWPTRRQSQVAAVLAMLTTGGWSAAQPTPALAALSCSALAVTGGYIALFHSPRLLILNGLVAVATATYAALRLADEADFVRTAAAFWLMLFPNFSVPLVIWGMSQAMGTYVQRAEQDPLTGLLNRRAFTEAVTLRLSHHAAGHTHLAVMMLDLDDFKRINDTHGHSAGDHLLCVVARLLRENGPADGIVCRAGGEEFVVALTCTINDVAPLASLFCDLVAALPSGITASIGTASAELQPLRNGEAEEFVDKLVALADDAMYAAKRSGGNQAHHSTGW